MVCKLPREGIGNVYGTVERITRHLNLVLRGQVPRGMPFTQIQYIYRYLQDMTSDTSASLSISVTELTKTYGKVFALKRVSIDVKAGEFLTLLGPSGSGKTTLLMAIDGFNRPDSGRICFGDDDVTVLPPHKRGVGMVFQNYALFPHMSVFENVAFPLKLRKILADEKRQRVTEALQTVQ